MTRRKAEQIGKILNVLSWISATGVLFPGIFGQTAIVNAFSAVGILCFFAGAFFLLRYPEVFVVDEEGASEKGAGDQI